MLPTTSRQTSGWRSPLGSRGSRATGRTSGRGSSRSAARDSPTIGEPLCAGVPIPFDRAAFAGQHAEDDPEDETVDKISAQEAASLIASALPGDQAEVVLLRVLADLDVDQVAAIMQRSPNWVRCHRHRAVENLAKRLGPKIVVDR